MNGRLLTLASIRNLGHSDGRPKRSTRKPLPRGWVMGWGRQRSVVRRPGPVKATGPFLWKKTIYPFKTECLSYQHRASSSSQHKILTVFLQISLRRGNLAVKGVKLDAHWKVIPVLAAPWQSHVACDRCPPTNQSCEIADARLKSSGRFSLTPHGNQQIR